jgi:hypothetical protein
MYQRHHDDNSQIIRKTHGYHYIIPLGITNTPLFAKYIHRAYEEYNIQQILQRCYPGIIIAIMRIGGLNDFTYVSGLKRHFKECKIIEPYDYAGMKLHTFINLVRNYQGNMIFKVWIGVNTQSSTWDNSKRNMHTLKRILHNPNMYRSQNRIRNFTVPQLLALRTCTQHMETVHERSLVKARLHEMMLTAYNINYSSYMYIRVRFSPFINSKFVTSVVKTHLKTLSLPPAYKDKLIDRVKVVFTKSPDIAKILINNIAFAKKYRHDEVFACICKIDDNHHQKLRAKDFQEDNILFKTLNQNSKNIPTPTRLYAIRDIKHAIMNYSQQVRSMTGYNMSNTNQKCIIDTLIKHIRDNNKSLFEKENHLLKSYIHVDSDSVTDIEVQMTKKTLSKFVLCRADKNNGECILLCPKDYHCALTKAYVNDKHYEKIGTNLHNVIIALETQFKKQKWFKYAGWNRKGQLPYVYLNPKYKDLNRYRPLMSYSNHYLRALFKLAGSALTFMLLQIPMRYQHFNLFNMTCVKTFIDSTNKQFATLDVDAIYPFLVDISNMYTEMQHTTIMKALIWLVGVTSSHERGRDRIAIRRFKSKKFVTHWGRSYNKFTHIEMNIETLIMIIQFDMNNVYFTLGDILLRQINGIPMGGFISAPEAQLVCIYSEVQFHESCGLDSRYISGTRYMDDLTVFIAYNTHNEHSLIRTSNIIHALCHTYDESLVLEVQESRSDGTYTFLDSLVRIHDATVSIEPFHKNWEYLLEHGTQKLYKLQRYDSYSSAKTKIAMILGTLHRLNNTSMNETILRESVVKLWTELRILRYPTKMIEKALLQMFHSTQDAKWMHTLMYIQHR